MTRLRAYKKMCERLLTLPSFNSLFVTNRPPTPEPPGAFWGRFWGCIMLPVMLLLWLAASWAGVSLGYKIRSKISREDD